ncbi:MULTISPECIES: hypothetical protein [Streptomyces]|uniref:hypothetical protein n=1 Tax=Streptomyces TaxID=1883 RepID=UPI0010C08676|nr:MULTISPECIES: hypothetical protein [unclassified Streptomyces]MCI4046635.1 hypothetical protein [Streptomyces sp. TRM75563]
MTNRFDDDGDHEGVAPSPGEEVADQERDYWVNRRLTQELDDDDAGRRERRRLKAQERKIHLRVRMHRFARRQGEGPLPSALVLPPLPRDDDFHDHDFRDSDHDLY